MVGRTLNKRLLRMIASTRGQFFASVLIITIGIFTYTAVTNAAINLEQTLTDYYEDTNFADVFISTAYISQSQEDKLRHLPSVAETTGRIVTDVPMLTDDDNERVTVRLISTQSSKDAVNTLHLKQGRLETLPGEILVIDQFAQGRHIQVGDHLNLQINGRSQPFSVVGIVASSEFVYMMQDAQTILPDPRNFGVVYGDLSYLQQITGHHGMINDLLVTLKDPSLAESFITDVKDNSKLPILKAISRQNQMSASMLQQEVENLQKVSGSMPMIFLFFAAIMLMTMLSRSVKNDRMTIGVLKALGYSSREIVTHYTLYAFLAGLAGSILGNILGLALASLLTRFFLLYFNIPTYTIQLYANQIFFTFLGTGLLATAAGILGSRSIIKITPADAMRPEPPKQGRHIWLDNHLPAVWKKLRFSQKMILRSLSREKKKALLIIAGVAMTYGMLLATFWFNDVFQSMAVRHFEETMTMDYTLSTHGFCDASVVDELSRLPEVEVAENVLTLPCDLTFGPYTKSVAITGLEHDTQFVTLKDDGGYHLSLDSSGIIISSNLAKSLHVSIGDTLNVKNLLMDNKEAAIPIVGINEQLLGVGAYMSLDALSENLADKHLSNGFYIKSDEDLNEIFRDMNIISAISSKAELQATYASFTGLMIGSVIFLVIFSGILGSAIIYSTTIMSLHERTAEFSSLRVLGYRKKEIFHLLSGENMLLSCIGLVAGLPLGWGLIKLMGMSFTTDLYTLSEPIRLSAVVLALISSVIFIVLAQLITYRRIAHMDFIQALKARIS